LVICFLSKKFDNIYLGLTQGSTVNKPVFFYDFIQKKGNFVNDKTSYNPSDISKGFSLQYKSLQL